ncbi:MAG: phenylpyruvate tautomerase MIF-related protein [Methylobacter sp.]
MPYLKLTTNIAINKEQSPKLLNQFSQLLAKETGKPERYVMVELAGDKDMLFGASNEPLAYVECKSIGLSAQQAQSLSASISQLLASSLQLSADRVYIEFSNCPGNLWGWNGSTFG